MPLRLLSHSEDPQDHNQTKSVNFNEKIAIRLRHQFSSRDRRYALIPQGECP